MLPLSFFASSIVGTSTRISFFQGFREFLIKSLHSRASRRFPLIDRLINGVGSRISLKPPIWQLFARSSGSLILSQFSRKPLICVKIFQSSKLFPPTKISNPIFHLNLFFSLFNLRCRFFLSLGFSLLLSK
mgnify:CR=1 FL=1